MTDRWRIEVGRVVVRGVPPGPLDEGELRSLVAGAVGERLAAAALPTARRASSVLRVEARRLAGGTGALAAAVANAVAGSVIGGSRDAGHGRG